LPIRANEKLLPSRKLELGEGDVPEMLQRYAAQTH